MHREGSGRSLGIAAVLTSYGGLCGNLLGMSPDTLICQERLKGPLLPRMTRLGLISLFFVTVSRSSFYLEFDEDADCRYMS